MYGKPGDVQVRVSLLGPVSMDMQILHKAGPGNPTSGNIQGERQKQMNSIRPLDLSAAFVAEAGYPNSINREISLFLSRTRVGTHPFQLLGLFAQG